MQCNALCKNGFACRRRCECVDHERKVEIVFVRHGFSCANATARFEEDFEAHLHDPALTNAAVEDLKLTKAPAVDLVFCSTLLRAQETALRMFSNYPVYVVPFVSETGSEIENSAGTVAQQKKWHREHGTGVSRLHYEWATKNGRYTKDVNVSSWPKFLRWLRHWLVCSAQKHWKIAVVCHADLISTIFETDDYLYNLGQVTKTYKITNKTVQDVSPPQKRLRIKHPRVLSAGVKPPKHFHPRHVARCAIKR